MLLMRYIVLIEVDMQTATWDMYLNLLKVLNCTSRGVWQDILNVASWSYPEEFDDVWDAYKQRGLFNALCCLDSNNLKLMMDYAVRETLTHE